MKKAFATPILMQLARKFGIKIVVEPRYGFAGQIVLAEGTKKYFRGSNFDLNPLGASEIARDKTYAAFFLQKLGYPVIEGESFFSPAWCKIIQSHRNIEAAYRYAKKIGWPIIVKPNGLSQGSGVEKIYTRRDFFRAVKAICKKDRVFLVQREAKGRDYRIVVLDGEVMSAYERLPLQVQGDGKSTIIQLLDKKQKYFNAIDRDTIIKKDDIRITGRLNRLELTRQNILPKGKVIALLDNRNLSSGGDAVDATNDIHPSFARLCISITRDMGLRYCGVDLMIDGDIRDPVKQYRIIEINAAPGIDHYAHTGRKQKIIVNKMYEKVFLALIKK